MSSSTRRAVILGGTGAIGAATAERLVGNGWDVDVTGRDPGRMPPELAHAGVRFHAIDRRDSAAVWRLVGSGADLLVDLLAYERDDVRNLLPAMADCASLVVASTRAVYVDDEGRHLNGDQPPRFPLPMPESTATLSPAAPGTNPFTREGYAPSKVAVEQEARGSGLPVTVLRLSKVHGPWARNARTRPIVEQMLAGAEVIELTDRGSSVDHLTAAANTAALIETVADAPGARVLNSADPDPLTALEIVHAIGSAIDWEGAVVGLEPGEAGGDHPWSAPHPIVLDMRAARELGYQPVTPGRELIGAETRWVAGLDHRLRSPRA